MFIKKALTYCRRGPSPLQTPRAKGICSSHSLSSAFLHATCLSLTVTPHNLTRQRTQSLGREDIKIAHVANVRISGHSLYRVCSCECRVGSSWKSTGSGLRYGAAMAFSACLALRCCSAFDKVVELFHEPTLKHAEPLPSK